MTGTKNAALREARGLLQQFGYNGFSFQHVADAVGVRKPSLYQHFESKEALGRALLAEYARSFREWAQTVAVFPPREKLAALFELYGAFAQRSAQVCPLSTLLSDFNSLPKALRAELRVLVRFQETWLEGVLREGQRAKIFRKDMSARGLAHLALSLGLGAQLGARSGSRGAAQLRAAARDFLRLIAS